MEAAKLRGKTEKELLEGLEASKRERSELGFAASRRELKDVSQLKKKKVEIAKILTVLGELKVLSKIKNKENKGKK